MVTAGNYMAWDRPSPMLDRLGDLRRHPTKPSTFGFTVDEPKLNGRGVLHAGALSTVADVLIGHTLSSLSQPQVRYVTTGLQMQFLGIGNAGDWVDVEVSMIHRGQRLAVGRADFLVASRVIAFAVGIFMPSRSTADSSTGGHP